MADGRVSQVVVELLSDPGSSSARVTQDVVELLVGQLNPDARVTQHVVELLSAVAPLPAVETFSAVLDGVGGRCG